MMCPKCGFTQTRNEYDENGAVIRISVLTGKPHRCDFGPVFECPCGSLIFLDKKVLARGSNTRIPLNYGDDTYHFCNFRNERGAAKK